MYDCLNTTVYECDESFYNNKIPPIIDEFEKAGLVEIKEGGAKCVFVDKFKVPLMLQKSDGGTGRIGRSSNLLPNSMFSDPYVPP